MKKHALVIGREVENDSVKRLVDERAKGENALPPLGNFLLALMSRGMINEIMRNGKRHGEIHG